MHWGEGGGLNNASAKLLHSNITSEMFVSRLDVDVANNTHFTFGNRKFTYNQNCKVCVVLTFSPQLPLFSSFHVTSPMNDAIFMQSQMEFLHYTKISASS